MKPPAAAAARSCSDLNSHSSEKKGFFLREKKIAKPCPRNRKKKEKKSHCINRAAVRSHSDLNSHIHSSVKNKGFVLREKKVAKSCPRNRKKSRIGSIAQPRRSCSDLEQSKKNFFFCKSVSNVSCPSKKKKVDPSFRCCLHKEKQKKKKGKLDIFLGCSPSPPPFFCPYVFLCLCFPQQHVSLTQIHPYLLQWDLNILPSMYVMYLDTIRCRAAKDHIFLLLEIRHFNAPCVVQD